jgi:Ca2+-transporting ATPase
MILWINLVTNGAPALALGIDPPDAALMDEAPRDAKGGLLAKRDYLGILFVGGIMGGLAVLVYALYSKSGEPAALDRARALAFSLLAISPLFHAWNCRSPHRSALASKPLFPKALILAVLASALIHLIAVVVPVLQPVFRTFDMATSEWLLLVGLSFAIIPAVELAKLVYRGMLRKSDAPPLSMRPPA